MMLELHRPANFRKKVGQSTSDVRSPLSLDEEPFLNYWNLNQTVMLQGRASVQKFNTFIEVVQQNNP